MKQLSVLGEAIMARVHPSLTITTAFAITTALGAFCESAGAQGQVETRIAAGVQKIEAACSADIKKFCSTVTPGDSRLMLCIQAHEDQISVQCDYALFDASRNLERALDRVAQIANVCWNDIEQFCSHLPEGGSWRIPQCLASQQVLLSPACKGATSPAAAQDVRPQRVKIEVYPPKTPDLQEAYDVLKRSRWMDEAQEFFGIFKLPQDITIFVRSCGMSNAWYVHGTLTVCYERMTLSRVYRPETLLTESRRATQPGDNLFTRSRTRWVMPCLISLKFRYWGHPRMLPMISRPT